MKSSCARRKPRAPSFKAANLDALTNGARRRQHRWRQYGVQSARNDLGAAEVTVNSLKSQLAGMPQTVASDQLPMVSEKGTIGGSSTPLVRLRQAEQNLMDLRTQYTDDYPGVIEAKQMITQLQKQVAEYDNPKTAPVNSIGVPIRSTPTCATGCPPPKCRWPFSSTRVGVATQKLETRQEKLHPDDGDRQQICRSRPRL